MFVSALIVFLLAGFSGRAVGQDAQRRTLHGHVPAAATGTPTGRFAVTNRLNLAIGLPLRNRAELGKFLRELYDPTSTNFHKYLSSQEFTERFGPTEEDYQAVGRFAETNGLHVTHTLGNRLVLDVEGGVPDIERAFQVTLRTYRHPTESRDFMAPDREPSVPADLPVADVGGLSNFNRPHPLVRPARAALQPLVGSAPGGDYGGSDFRNAYAPGVALNGSGQSVGLLEFDGYNFRDITNYENDVKLTSSAVLTNVLVDGFSGRAGGNNIEVALDIEMAMSMAPGASQIIVYEGNPNDFIPLDVISRMASDDLAKQMSSSWFWTGGPDTNIDNVFLEMQAQGQSFYQASGDDDAYTGPLILDDPSQTNWPATSTNITVVGGTTLTMNGSGGSWSSETVWNWASLGGSDANVGSGGGVSRSNGIPWWQTDVNMSANNGSTTMRNIPDVALTADNVFLVYTAGSGRSSSSTEGSVGGTSCAAPLWAGFTALINEQAALSGKPTVGFANPAIYRIGAGPNYTNCFHDITTGNNVGTGTAGLYKATNGYDLCTGWGTPNGTNLINALASLPPYIIQAPTSLTASNGQAAVLSVIPGGEPPFGYQWQLNGTNLAANGTISGIGSNVLTFTSLTANYAGSYTVIVTNSFGSVTSGAATVTVIVTTNQPPVLGFIPDQTITALTTLLFTNTATDSDGDALTFSLDPGAPTNATINAVTGVFSWTPTVAQAPGTNSITVRVTDNSTTLSAAQAFTVVVNQITQPPTLQPIANQTVYAGATLTFTASASDIDGDALAFSLGPGAPAGASIGSSTGVFSWTPTQAQGPSTNRITASVTDTGVPTLSATQSFTVTVLTSNLPPVLAAISNETIYATTTLTITNVASDPNNPPETLTFSLDPGAPTNAIINPTSGVFTWTPTQPQAPSTNLITVRVTDDAVPPLSAAQSFTAIVLPTNFPPVLTPIANEIIHVGMTLVVTNSAIDPNDPTNTLQFSLDPGAPTTASIDPGSGIFIWTPDSTYANTTNEITVRVTDNAVPPLSAAQSFTVAVVPLAFQSAALSNGVLTISWGAISGLTYRVQYTTNLADANWTDLLPDVMATGNIAITTDFTQPDAQRFYRVLVLP